MPSKLYRQRTDAVTASLGDELAVLDMETGAYVGFNATAAHVWRLIEEPRTLDDLCAAMTAEFDVDPTQCRTAVARLLSRLEAAGLAEQTDG